MMIARAAHKPTPSSPHGGSRRYTVRVCLLLASVLAAASVAAQKTEGQETLVRRYPFDPACAWGRIANGKGMIVRCMTEDEASQVLRRAPSVPPVAASAGVSPSPAAAPSPPVSTGNLVDPPPAAGPDQPAAPSSPDERLEVTVGPVVADQGELSAGKLTQAKARYARCVSDHGGLRDRSGEVHVRFLVRSKGIAEGVSVNKRINVSAEAARCVAEVVDRRRVGVPDAPLVGATVVVKFDRTSQ
ncbi:MAG TPA: hypothetical protein VER33_25285 [Polyangiaceae bacterium]|nr:hypothetical protein [Polyangiaceae bacterium]